MARKILVDSSNTVAVWVQKTNTMSDYMGDLNDLSSVFDSDLGDPLWPDQDSNFVSSLNHIAWLGPTVNQTLFGIVPTPGARGSVTNPLKITARIQADSGLFDKITVSKLFNTDIDLLTFDDSSFFGDSNQISGGLHFDFNADSARFGTITVHDSNNLDTLSGDSISIGNVLIGGTGKISRLFMDDSSTIIFKAARIISNGDSDMFDSVLVTDTIYIDSFYSQAGGDSGVVVDSAFINVLNIPNWDSSGLGDSAHFNTISADSGSFNKLRIQKIFDADSISINRLIMQSIIIDSVDPFILGDSIATPIFAAYQLEESN